MSSQHKTIKRRCERCEKMYDIPLIKESPAKNLLLEFFPCSHCAYVRGKIWNQKYNNSGRCVDCAIPFAIIKHQARGRCNRCLMRYLRQNATKEAEIARMV